MAFPVLLPSSASIPASTSVPQQLSPPSNFVHFVHHDLQLTQLKLDQFVPAFHQFQQLQLSSSSSTSSRPIVPFFLLHIDTSSATFQFHPLRDYATLTSSSSSSSSSSSAAASSSPSSRLLFCFVDPCNLATHMGWPCRNYLTFLSYFTRRQRVTILSFRDVFTVSPSSSSAQPSSELVLSSLVFDIQLPTWPSDAAAMSSAISSSSSSSSTPLLSSLFRVVGWEKNSSSKAVGPRFLSLSAHMDPTHLVSSSVALNVKLMKWRLFDSLNVPLLQQQRCLLIGAGTLGCNIARLLLAWSVQTLTFIDQATVSYSNPVRQSLYTVDDCFASATSSDINSTTTTSTSTRTGRSKAIAAAEACKKINPAATFRGLSLSVPMPGHVVSLNETQRTMELVNTLDKLIDEHDIIFLLTDSRESRWLPTVICAAKNKMCINTALGFDSFVVLRHGVRQRDSESFPSSSVSSSASTGSASDKQLGCYFCNDVVAPVDSMRDRTLDQQCTVTRPGLAYMASAIAVELAVATLHHPKRHFAPAINQVSDELHGFGSLPHQLRGFLNRFETIPVVGEAFNQCTACSPPVVSAYQSGGAQFVLDVMNNPPSFLEDVCGLTKVKAEAESAFAEMAAVEEEDEDHEWTNAGGTPTKHDADDF